MHITTTGISLGSYSGNNNQTNIDITASKFHLTTSGLLKIDAGNF